MLVSGVRPTWTQRRLTLNNSPWHDLPMAPLTVLLLAGHLQVATAEIYSAVLATLSPSVGKVIVVESDALGISSIFRDANPSWSAQFNNWPAELLAVLEGKSSSPAPGPLSQADVPPGAQLISRSRIHEIFRADSMNGWSQFRHLTGAPSWQGFSKPILTSDGHHALVYAEHHCGIVCGQGEYLWLSRTDEPAGWRIKARVVRWIS